MGVDLHRILGLGAQIVFADHHWIQPIHHRGKCHRPATCKLDLHGGTLL